MKADLTQAIQDPRQPPIASAMVLGLTGLILLVVLTLLHPTLGEGGRGVSVVVEAVLWPTDTLDHVLIRHMRLPRTFAAIVAGAALGAAGALFQAATRNPLASPGVLGVNAGAFLALTVAAVSGAILPAVPVAFVGALAATLLTIVVAGGVGAGPLHLVLAGVAVSLALGALANGVALLREENVTGVLLWAAGSIVQDSWKRPVASMPFAVAGMIIALLLGRALDILALGDDAARGRGQAVNLVRMGSATAGALLASAAVALVGPIGFVGLVVPNALRLVAIRRATALLPLSMLWGAVFLVAADMIAQLARTGNTELPAGMIVALVGGPVFLFMLHRNRVSATAELRRPETRRKRSRQLSIRSVAAVLALTLFAVALLAMSVGEIFLTPRELLALLGSSENSLARTFVLELRLPRILVAMLSGAMFALSGVLLQGLLRNPLASPDLIGVSQAAGVGALLLTLAVPGVSLLLIQAAAFASGLAVLLLLLALARRDRLSGGRLALRGLAVAALFAAVSHLLVVEAGLQGAVALIWLAGTTYARGWAELASLLPWAVVLIPLAFICIRPLDVMALGEDLPRVLGVKLAQTRALILSLAVALAAAAVATVGTVAFIGLVAPHAARLVVGARHRGLVVIAPLLGALMMGSADVLGRIALAPKEVPVGLVTALIGAPYFLMLLYRARTVH